MRKYHWVRVFFVLLLAGCSGAPTHPALKAANLPEAIPIEEIIINKDASFDYQISPDGKKLAWIGYHNDFYRLCAKPIDQQDAANIESEGWSNVIWFTWVNDSRHLLFKTDLPGKYRGHIYLADMLNPERAPVDLTPGTKVNAIFYQNIALDSGNVLLSHNRRCRHCYDLYKVNLETGEETLLSTSHSNVIQWICDRKGDMRGRIRVVGNQKQLDIYNTSEDGWEQLIRWDFREQVRFQCFTPDQKGLWLLSNRGRDRRALTVLDIAGKTERVIYEDPQVDLDSVFIGQGSDSPKAVLSYLDYPRIHAIDPEIKDGLSLFRADRPAGIEITSMNDQENVWAVKTFDDKGESFFLYNTETREKVHIGDHRTQAVNQLSDVAPITIKSRDDLNLSGYITLPKGAESKPLPTVLLVHGGPWARCYWNFNNMVQFLANRGYAVLQINFRGSTGYGLEFKEAAINEFGKKMHTDLLDAVQWAIEEGIADPGKIAIMGGSYGGYAALLGLTLTPGVFACGISINGLSDVKMFLESLATDPPLYQKPGIEIWYTYVGKPKDPELDDLLREKSPLYLAGNITRPVLIVYGERDGRVDPDQSKKMIKKLETMNKTVEHLEFMNEKHSITKLQNSIALLHVVEKFLAKHLGGRYTHRKSGSRSN